MTGRGRIVRFGVFDFDLASEQLYRSGVRVKLPNQPATLLALLLSEPGSLVTREAIRARLWPDGTWVDYEQSINQCIRQVRRALRDDAVAARFVETVPRVGYRFVGEVEIVEVDGEHLATALSKRKHGAAVGLRVALALGVALLCALGVGVARFTRDRGGDATAAGSFDRVRFDKLTSHGAVWTAAISPDGTHMAYAVQEPSGFAVRSKAIGVTGDAAIVEPQPTPVHALQFSPTGRDLYFVRQETLALGYSALYRVSLRGGEPKRVVFDIDTGVSFSPDGARFAFIRNDPSRDATALFTARTDGTDEIVVSRWTAGDRLHLVTPAWSPDGTRIAVATSRAGDAPRVSLSTVAVADGSASAVGAYPWREISGLAWLPDGSALVVASRASDVEPRAQLWRVDHPEGAVRRISDDLSTYLGISLASSGQRFVTLRQERLDPVLAFEEPGGKLRRRALDFAPPNANLLVRRGPDQSAIVLIRDARGTEVWRVSDGEAEPERLLPTGDHEVRGVSVSPDGGTLVFVDVSTGVAHLWTVSARGGEPRPLTNGAGEFAPTACPAGTIVFRRQDEAGLWVMNDRGAEPRQISDLEPWAPAHCSPSGTHVAFVSDGTLVVLPTAGDGPPQLTPWTDGGQLAWAPEGDALTCAGRTNAPGKVWKILPGASEAEPLFESQGGGVTTFDWSADGRTLIAIHGAMQSDVVLVDDTR